MSIKSVIYKPISDFTTKAKYSLVYGNRAAVKLQNAKNMSTDSFTKTRIMLESVRRNHPEAFYPAVGFCSGIPGGTTVGVVLGLLMKCLKKH